MMVEPEGLHLITEHLTIVVIWIINISVKVTTNQQVAMLEDLCLKESSDGGGLYMTDNDVGGFVLSVRSRHSKFV